MTVVKLSTWGGLPHKTPLESSPSNGCRKPTADVVKSQGAVVETEPIVVWKRSERLTERRGKKQRHFCGHKGTRHRPTDMDLRSRRERGRALFRGDPRRPLGETRNTKS